MKRLFVLLMALALVLTLFSACGSDEPQSENGKTEAPVETPAPTPVPDDDIIERLGLVNVGRNVTDTAEDVMNKESGAKTIYVKDYDAKGDGVTDDRTAIRNAIRALKAEPAGSTLQFESGKTYYCGSKSGAAINLSGVKDRIIKGENTTILIDAPAQFASIQNCKNFVIDGLNFNYKTKPYAISTKVENADSSKRTAVITFDRSLGIEKDYSTTYAEFFGVVNRSDDRYHLGVSKIEIIDKEAYKYKVTFSGVFAEAKQRVEMLEEFGFIIPVPSIGHAVEQAFTVMQNDNLTMKNGNVWSACKFMFFLKSNEGKVLFENFNVTPDPAEKNCIITGWRDGFHCKENRAQIIWKDCTLEWVYDDVFNISCSMTKIKTVDGDKITITWPETGGAYGSVKKGDILEFWNSKTGENLGTVTVKAAKGDNITLENEVEGLSSNVYVADRSLAAPNSQIIHCKLNGTFRIRSQAYIVDSDIFCQRMWLAWEKLEGPWPKNILFTNCNFEFGTTADIQIDSGNSVGYKTLKKGTFTADRITHAQNIVFNHCKLDQSKITYGKAESIIDSGVVEFIECK